MFQIILTYSANEIQRAKSNSTSTALACGSQRGTDAAADIVASYRLCALFSQVCRQRFAGQSTVAQRCQADKLQSKRHQQLHHARVILIRQHAKQEHYFLLRKQLPQARRQCFRTLRIVPAVNEKQRRTLHRFKPGWPFHVCKSGLDRFLVDAPAAFPQGGHRFQNRRRVMQLMCAKKRQAISSAFPQEALSIEALRYQLQLRKSIDAPFSAQTFRTTAVTSGAPS